MTFHSVVNYKPQKGAALLAFVLVLLVGSSYSLVKKLNANTSFYTRDVTTSATLRQAKQALIGYAVTYPDKVNPDYGPGYLLCPDINNNGSAGGSCSSGGNTTIGRFPFKTLEVQELKDASGQRLWYALSDNFRNNPKLEPLNSETSGQFTVDGVDDFVAIIIAPGTPLDSQNRDPDETDIAVEISQYLEADNNDFDTDFVTSDAGDFNDRLMFITRQELMEQVEKRVLGETLRVINDYQTAHSMFPWLSPFSNPDTSTFKSTTATYEGHLPFHYSGDVAGASNRNPFTDDITLAWTNITNATLSEIPDNDASGAPILPSPSQACVVSSQCSDAGDLFNGLVPSVNNIAGASCIWTNRDDFNCTGSFNFTQNNIIINGADYDEYGKKLSAPAGLTLFETDTGEEISVYINTAGKGLKTWTITPWLQGDLDRDYQFDITFTNNTNDGSVINAADSSSNRSRDLEINSGTLTADLVNITITDTLTNITYSPNYAGAPATKTAIRSLLSDVDTTGTIAATDIIYDLDVDGIDRNGDGDFGDSGTDVNGNGNYYEAGDTPPEVNRELPEWFVKNEWQTQVYLAYSTSEPIPGDPSPAKDCNKLGVCLTLNGAGGVNDDKRAIAIIAGGDLTPATPRPNGSLFDYFENENSDAPFDGVLEKGDITTSFNDQLKIISSVP